MKSQQVMNVIPKEEWDRYSDLQVMFSGSGYYIGTIYTGEDGMLEPGSRDSLEYYSTPEEADAALAGKAWTQRMTP